MGNCNLKSLKSLESLLLIDTALETASVAIAREGVIVAQRDNTRQNDHAGWLHTAIQELMTETALSFSELQAVGVVDGPGSYTGMRVGLSAAKGICYAHNIPLITVSSLQLLAGSVAEQATDLILALIDARRQEVYAGLYDKDLNLIQPELAIVLAPDSFEELFSTREVLLTGNGVSKAMSIIQYNDLRMLESGQTGTIFAMLTDKKLLSEQWASLAYHEPRYLKNFYINPKGTG